MSRVKKKCPKIVFYLENPLTAAYGVFGHSFLVTEMVRIYPDFMTDFEQK